MAAALAAAAVFLVAGCELLQGKDPEEGSASPVPSSSLGPSSTFPSPTTTTTYEPAPRIFDHAAVQDAVHKVLAEYHQVADLGVVTCPRKVEVRKGAKFHCTATIDGEKKKVPITVTSDEGNYKVGAPK